ncbi:uncharacterized protein LOC100833544 [Brachypodium distachyon]|uniref:Uncharacterized protein n=1 Tax=Brachypodium distachyon TaxID=15368 RepID=I1IW74_BRADI|nr:uncharacterized protein LOC100833544 [Brachypodium distachyon]KQJ81819.2 hypothetical protein BRADI_5g03270v3 [Brachypodium distachyon]|eukprot:XP_003581041.1 uncharacterized protein LOC100833544 [Brachypodium distachyon]
MADWSMEPAVWVPSDYQLSDWSMEPAPAAWVSGLPIEYLSTEMLGSSCYQYQVSVPGSSEGQQKLVEYAAAAATATPAEQRRAGQQQRREVADFHATEPKMNHSPIRVFEKSAHEFKVDIDKTRTKMHRYPTYFPDLGPRYNVPSTVAIGPYHHHRRHLHPAEDVKHVAAYHCIKQSGGHTVQEMYDAVVSVADVARSLYDKDVVSGISNDDFLPMMFYDACFLVQYMLTCTSDGLDEMDDSLRSFFDSNDEAIFNDIMLLENQLPWLVMEALLRFRPVPLEDFVTALKGFLQDRKDLSIHTVVLDDSFQPPHLLGLLRFYVVGRSNAIAKRKPLPPTEFISFSVSAVELAQIGITLAVSKTTELMEIGIHKGNFFGELSLPQLSLDATNASILVNMAAFELCATPNFQADLVDENSAVCSYLQHMAMIVDREEDVHELRSKRVLQGGGGLTNKDVLEFFTSLQDLRLGSCYVRTMEEIESYRKRRWIWIVILKFYNENKRTIATVFSAVAALAGILGTLMSLKK